MYSIGLFKNEHLVMTRFFSVVKKMCCHILDGNEVNDADMRIAIDFIKIYIEGYHHKKEEEYLFTQLSNLNSTAATMVKGLTSDHVRVHKYMLSFENALDLYKKNPKTEYKLDILVQAMSYIQVLKLCNDKESNVVYSFATSGLSAEQQDELDKKCRAVEDDALIKSARDVQLRAIDALCNRYGV